MYEAFTALAPHLQMVVAVVILIVCGCWAVIKFTKPFIDNIHKPSAVNPTDAVVISAALADSKSVSDLRASIDRLNETHHKSNIIGEMNYEILTKICMKLDR